MALTTFVLQYKIVPRIYERKIVFSLGAVLKGEKKWHVLVQYLLQRSLVH